MRACERFLELINNYPDIENLLDHYRFQAKDITVFIGFNHKLDELVNYGTIGNKLALVSIHHGIVYYGKCHPTKEEYIDIHEKSFEEAVKIVHNN